ncbi:MAG TPA: HAD-IIA family hydrolase [Candidatus Deferrimicrobiaceae bacterium]|jgi:4-nitrophenyl phosphatase|nr:HAD-IIA family hydrolase [Candidatus Deferrimicrobiaceae bacterium]
MSPPKRSLREMRGLVFDLDGCVWTGEVLIPGAAQVLALIRQQGKGLCFLTNNSRARARTVQAKLVRLGVEAKEAEVLTPLEIVGEVVAQRWGPSRVLAIGGPELAEVLVEAGHHLVPVDAYRDATVVVVGNDFDFTYERLTAAARAVAAGAAFVTPNIDPRLPLEGGQFLPGCGAIVEAVATAAGVRPIVVGKPEPPLFELALQRMGTGVDEAAMVGDSIDSDVRGARRVGMTAVLFAPKGGPDGVAHYMVKSMAQLRRLLGP